LKSLASIPRVTDSPRVTLCSFSKPKRLLFDRIPIWPTKCIHLSNDNVPGGFKLISADVQLGERAVVFHPDLVNLYGCRIGGGTRIGSFVEIQKDVEVGSNCKISSHSFLCSGVTVEDSVFIGHGVMFINDMYPSAVNSDGGLQTADDWECLTTTVRHNASIGSNATILGGVTIGRHSLVGAGAVVNRDVPDYAIVAGVPAQVIGDVREKKLSVAQGTGAAVAARLR
jgi:UDP-2-acetamido-3-amino-2,3-dideoxy-glucuronate N-acetyltransferase